MCSNIRYNLKKINVVPLAAGETQAGIPQAIDLNVFEHHTIKDFKKYIFEKYYKIIYAINASISYQYLHFQQ